MPEWRERPGRRATANHQNTLRRNDNGGSVHYPLIALKIALDHAAWARLVLIYKGMLLSAHGHGLAALAHAAITTAQSVGVVGALQMVAQMLLIIGTVGVGSLAAEEAWGALKAMGDGDHAKALKKGRRAMKHAGPVLRVWTPSVSGW